MSEVAANFDSIIVRAARFDFDGDGQSDFAVFRPSVGTWFIQQSRLGFAGIRFGLSTDLPISADFDGDGKSDIAVFRNGMWYLQQSANGFAAFAFGTANDKPISGSLIF